MAITVELEPASIEDNFFVVIKGIPCYRRLKNGRRISATPGQTRSLCIDDAYPRAMAEWLRDSVAAALRKYPNDKPEEPRLARTPVWKHLIAE